MKKNLDITKRTNFASPLAVRCVEVPLQQNSYGQGSNKLILESAYPIFFCFALDNIKLPVARNTIPPTNRADERSNRLVGQDSIPGPPPDHAFAAASNAVGEFKNSTAP